MGLNFDDQVRAKISDLAQRVKAGSIKGRFVRPENLHLTIEFLGEIEASRLGAIKEAMDELSYGPLTLELSKIGYFKRPEANIYWLGIRDNEQLFKIQATLHQALKDRGFKLEDRPYRPHISLGRKLIL
ncbi:MAG: RNA 2',3'-cyclic phosphodiesterase [Caldicoprobacterales bacterium]